MPRAPAYRIVHLSDLHLTRKDDDERSEPKLLGRLTGMNAAFRTIVSARCVKGADLLVVTGDVTDRGDIEAWRVFWEAVDRAGLLHKTLVVPGNHDVCCLGARWFGEYAAEDLAKAQRGLSLAGRVHTRFPWVDQLDERLVVFGINSNNLGNLTGLNNALGHIGLHQLSNLASKMYPFRNVPVKMVLLHHSPNLPDAKVQKKRGLEPVRRRKIGGLQMAFDQEVSLQLLCITHRVRRVLHGHLHRAEVRRVAGVRIVGAPATTQPHRDAGGSHYAFFTHVIYGTTHRVRTEVHKVRP